jgi:hypothetical protein
LEHETELHRVISALIHQQRMLLASPDLLKRFGVLWIAATLDNRLKECTDREIGELLSLTLDRFHIFEPEFALCHHARQRLLLRTKKENLTK